MDEENWRKRLRDAASCPVCMDYLTDPVTLECGHNFCSSCVASCWRLSPGNAICPQCWRVIETTELSTNIQLANLVEIAEDLINRRVFPMEEAEKEVAKAQIEAAIMNTTALLREYHQFLEEQEALLRSRLEEVKAEVTRRRDENLARLTGELTSLDDHIQELEEKQHQAATELQDQEGEGSIDVLDTSHCE